MPDKYQNKFRIPPARLQGWDYGSEAAYFITICTKNRGHFFGEIVADKMACSPLGLTVEQEWLKTPALRADMNLELAEYIVMPNHFHAIIMIGCNRYNGGGAGRDANDGRDANGGRDAMHCRDAMHGVSTGINDTGANANQFGPQSKNLASIVRGFKSAITTYARKNGMSDFAWQARFHDHIIRDGESFERIQQYIANNPLNWKEDKYNCE